MIFKVKLTKIILLRHQVARERLSAFVAKDL